MEEVQVLLVLNSIRFLRFANPWFSVMRDDE